MPTVYKRELPQGVCLIHQGQRTHPMGRRAIQDAFERASLMKLGILEENQSEKIQKH